MQSPDIKKIVQTPTIPDFGGVTAPVAELALLVDAIPPEYREDILLAALWLGTNKIFQESYMVGSLRSQLSECLLEETGTLHDFAAIQQFDPSVIERQLRPFAEAENPAQIMLAIHGLLSFLVNVL